MRRNLKHLPLYAWPADYKSFLLAPLQLPPSLVRNDINFGFFISVKRDACHGGRANKEQCHFDEPAEVVLSGERRNLKCLHLYPCPEDFKSFLLAPSHLPPSLVRNDINYGFFISVKRASCRGGWTKKKQCHFDEPAEVVLSGVRRNLKCLPLYPCPEDFKSFLLAPL